LRLAYQLGDWLLSLLPWDYLQYNFLFCVYHFFIRRLPQNDVWAFGLLVLEIVLGYHPLAYLQHAPKGLGESSFSGRRGGGAPMPPSAYYGAGGTGNLLYSIAQLREVPLPPASSRLLSPGLRDVLTLALRWVGAQKYEQVSVAWQLLCFGK
jgi:hypothetical protein